MTMCKKCTLVNICEGKRVGGGSETMVGYLGG